MFSPACVVGDSNEDLVEPKHLERTAGGRKPLSSKLASLGRRLAKIEQRLQLAEPKGPVADLAGPIEKLKEMLSKRGLATTSERS